jgi:hypothetical protein
MSRLQRSFSQIGCRGRGIVEKVRCDIFRVTQMLGTDNRTRSAEVVECSGNSVQAALEGRTDGVAGVPLSMEFDDLCLDGV